MSPKNFLAKANKATGVVALRLAPWAFEYLICFVASAVANAGVFHSRLNTAGLAFGAMAFFTLARYYVSSVVVKSLVLHERQKLVTQVASSPELLSTLLGGLAEKAATPEEVKSAGPYL